MGVRGPSTGPPEVSAPGDRRRGRTGDLMVAQEGPERLVSGAIAPDRDALHTKAVGTADESVPGLQVGRARQGEQQNDPERQDLSQDSTMASKR